MMGSNQNSASVALQVKGLSGLTDIETNTQSVTDPVMKDLHGGRSIERKNFIWYESCG